MNEKMTTTYYKVLEILYNHQVTIGKTEYCPLGQDEIATILQCNRMTVNSILQQLRDDGYVNYNHSRKYELTDKARNTVKLAKEIE